VTTPPEAPPDPAGGGDDVLELQPSSEKEARVSAPARTWVKQIFIVELLNNASS